MIRSIGAIDKEQKYLKKKFDRKEDLINIKARMNLYINKTPSMMKCSYGLNYYGTRDYKIN